MTPTELWDTTNDHPRDLMECVELRQPDPVRERKWKLAICEFARRAVEALALTVDVSLFHAITGYLDGDLPRVEYEDYRQTDPVGYPGSREGMDIRLAAAVGAATAALYVATASFERLFECLYWQQAELAFEDPDAELATQAAIFKNVFGNLFRPVAFDPVWRTEHTVGLAARMYENRDFAAMPILADALEEAGCDNADILAHCREPGTHVRGCCVVDLLLGKG